MARSQLTKTQMLHCGAAMPFRDVLVSLLLSMAVAVGSADTRRTEGGLDSVVLAHERPLP